MRKWIAAGAALVLLGIGAVGGYVLYQRDAAKDVRGSSTEEFVTTEEEEPAPPPVRPEAPGIVWPTFGYDNERHRVAPFALRPPFRRLWAFGARELIEFPPAVGWDRLYFTNNSGTMFAVNARTGKRAWKKAVGRCAAASPALADGTVFQVFLYRTPCSKRPERPTGEVIAFAHGFGRVLWRKRIGASETSPLVSDGVLYVGDWNGKVWALDATTGETRWTFTTQGAVKAALSLSGRRLYAASYDHHVYALDVRNGKLLWRAKVQPRLGKLGTFYSTPTAAYGRVYIGSTDRKVYSYGATSGKLRWSHRTGGFVYGSPAVWRKRVYVGSYDEHFYAFDAATGDVVWRFKANGPISGSATVMDGLVYFATLKRRTYALDARSGKLVWSAPDGQYSPIVADAERVYRVGLGRIYGLAPVR